MFLLMWFWERDRKSKLQPNFMFLLCYVIADSIDVLTDVIRSINIVTIYIKDQFVQLTLLYLLVNLLWVNNCFLPSCDWPDCIFNLSTLWYWGGDGWTFTSVMPRVGSKNVSFISVTALTSKMCFGTTRVWWKSSSLWGACLPVWTLPDGFFLKTTNNCFCSHSFRLFLTRIRIFLV